MKKTCFVLILILVFGLSLLSAQTANDPAIRPIINNFSANNNTGFSTQPLSNAEIDLIVQAGWRSPSAGNRQPWLITVIHNLNLMQQILPQASAGNILVVVSGDLSDAARKDAVILDCGLTAQSMFLAAHALGLGARQFTSGAIINRANGLKGELGIPAEHSTIIVTRIGKLSTGADAVTAPSARANINDKVRHVR